MAQILVVDDSLLVIDELTDYFIKEGYDIATAEDGYEGLKIVEGDPEIQLMFVDINMPNMDGLTMIDKIRNELGNNKVHILMLTTEDNPSMKAKAKALGVKGWIVKPFNGTAILGVVKRLLKL